MRTVIAIVVFSAVLLEGQDVKPERTCGANGQGLATWTYYQAVLERALRPPDWPDSLISMSVSVTGSEAKVVVRELRGKFELLRSAPEKDINKFLDDLDASCHLPPNPWEAADQLIKVNWEKRELSAEKFEQTHREFTSALSQYASNIQARYGPLLKTRETFIYLHTAEYSVVYDNKFEHIEINANDITSDPNKMDPVVKWTRDILKLSEETFSKK